MIYQLSNWIRLLISSENISDITKQSGTWQSDSLNNMPVSIQIFAY